MESESLHHTTDILETRQTSTGNNRGIHFAWLEVDFPPGASSDSPRRKGHTDLHGHEFEGGGG